MQPRNLLKWLTVLFLVIVVPFSVFARTSKSALPENLATPHVLPNTGTVEVGFSPDGGITAMIVGELNSAEKSIEVQAYSFTNPEIAKALVEAHRRGVKVRVILDKSQQNGKYSSATFLSNAGITVHIDKAFQIAHNKIMIIDDRHLITGSFNFTKAAEQSNAENCLLFRGNQSLVNIYKANWQWRWDRTQ
jgi:phosphatidylserine/phosphatidylglycerophosphate/cardiolipin synthase-like enzyme